MRAFAVAAAGVHPSSLSLLLRHLLLTQQTCEKHMGLRAVDINPEVEGLPEDLLATSKPKDPAPLPCEDLTTAAKGPGMDRVAVEDAQVGRPVQVARLAPALYVIDFDVVLKVLSQSI